MGTVDNTELKHAVELSFNTTISLLEKAHVIPASDELRKALPEVLSALEAVEKLSEALTMYADDMFYFPRGIVLECQKKGVRLAPCYSEFGKRAKEALSSTESATVELPKCDHCGAIACGTDCDGSSHYTPDGRQ
jgi:hypothetical protein